MVTHLALPQGAAVAGALPDLRRALGAGDVVALDLQGRAPEVLLEVVEGLGLVPAPADPRTVPPGGDPHLHVNSRGAGDPLENPSEAWHTDDAHVVLYPFTAVLPTVVPKGAYTEFCDLRALQRHLAGTTDLEAAETAHAYKDGPLVRHPLVVRDPWSGQSGLSLNDVTLREVTGLGRERSRYAGEALLRWTRELHAQARPSTFRAAWSTGTALVWSNHVWLHRGSRRPPDTTRTLVRVVAA